MHILVPSVGFAGRSVKRDGREGIEIDPLAAFKKQSAPRRTLDLYLGGKVKLLHRGGCKIKT